MRAAVAAPARSPSRLFRKLALAARLCAVAALVAACAARPAVPPGRPAVDWAAYEGLVVPAPILPFEASGSALIHYRGERETGSIRVAGTRRQAYALVLSARVLGTTALEVRFDPQALLILDYAAETYFLGPNSPDNRLRAFAVDMTPEEFLMAVTGRVPRAAFRRGGGTLDGLGGATFQQDGAEYIFALGDDGLPREWWKYEAGAPRYRVAYREYMAVETGGDRLRVPRKIRIYDQDDAPLAVLGIGEFRPWRDGGGEIAFDPAAFGDLEYRSLAGEPAAPE